MIQTFGHLVLRHWAIWQIAGRLLFVEEPCWVLIDRLKPLEFREPLVAADWSRPLTLLFAGAPVTVAAGRPETVSEVAGWLRLPRGGGVAGGADWFEAEVFPALLAADCDGFAVRPSDPEDEPLVARDEGTCFRSDGSALSVSPDGRAVCTVRAGLAVSAGY
jgi:hypothetical protein